MGTVRDIRGERFGRLIALKLGVPRRKPSGRQERTWLCACDCGKKTIAWQTALTTGNTRSCGCLHREIGRVALTKHGKTNTRIFRIWSGIKSRCLNPRCPAWKHYGGRGITLCERWRSFENFYADIGDAPLGLSIDRIDNDKGYEPGNVRWATSLEQARNRRPTKWPRVLTPEKAREAGLRHLAGEPARRIAAEMGVSHPTVQLAAKRLAKELAP